MDKNSLSPMIIKRNMFGEGGTQLVRKGGTEGRGGEGEQAQRVLSVCHPVHFPFSQAVCAVEVPCRSGETVHGSAERVP